MPGRKTDRREFVGAQGILQDFFQAGLKSFSVLEVDGLFADDPMAINQKRGGDSQDAAELPFHLGRRQQKGVMDAAFIGEPLHCDRPRCRAPKAGELPSCARPRQEVVELRETLPVNDGLAWLNASLGVAEQPQPSG